MSATGLVSWEDFLKRYNWFESVGLAIDFSRTTMPLDYADQKQPLVQRALDEMRELEAGAIANPDENRMVGHYWLRNPDLAPTSEIRSEIVQALANIKSFAADVHAGRLCGATGPFKRILLIGIGGSALGPQFVANALGHPKQDQMEIHFIDNTDPDGFDRTFAKLDGHFGETLCIVTSKSGGTKETRNGMIETESAYRARGFDFAKHAIAVTSRGSELSNRASTWIASFPMWDWVGGRTSELSPVGLLPAALQGIAIDDLLHGAREMDNVTRSGIVAQNPALSTALYWLYIGNGFGDRAMVVLPYKDRLELLSKYLQQLVMESIGKRLDRSGNEVGQGLSVYGNKGSTDQHAYVQQLRDGLANFFCLFIEVLKDRFATNQEVEPQITSGDYLLGFLLGTREALYEMKRESVTLTITEVKAFTVGALIAFFERTVGLYASLIGINAYHQPGVEAGKEAASEIIRLERALLEFLQSVRPRLFSVQEIAQAVGFAGRQDLTFKICRHLASNGRLMGSNINSPSLAKFGM